MKILLVNMPYTYSNRYPLGLAYLKSYLDIHGVECDLLDLNMLYHHNHITIQKLDKRISKIQFSNIVLNDEIRKKEFKCLIEQHIDKFKGYDVIGCSIFLDIGAIHFEEMFDIIKSHLKKDVRIIVGGNYAKYGNMSHVTSIIPDEDICRGDGEPFFDNLFNINRKVTPFSYRQYIDPDQVHLYDRIDVFYSKGCIHNCIFCSNKNNKMDKIFLRDIDSIIDEMCYVIEQGINTEISLRTENIINSLAHFNEFITKLMNVTNKNNKGMTWTANFAFEHFDKHRSVIKWDKIAASGCKHLIIGIESFSEKIRRDLDKAKFTNDDILNYLETFRRNNISCKFHIIIGYITETEEDFQEHLDFADIVFKEYSDVISIVNVIPYVLVFQDTHEFDITYDQDGHWIYNNNDIQERFRRTERFVNILNKHNMTPSRKKVYV